MADLFWLTPNQMKRIKRYLSLSHGVPRVDDRRVISGIIHVIRNGPRWRDAPADYRPYKTSPFLTTRRSTASDAASRTCSAG